MVNRCLEVASPCMSYDGSLSFHEVITLASIVEKGHLR